MDLRPADLDHDACYRAVVQRDPRFRRPLFHRREDDRHLLPTDLPGTHAAPRERDLLSDGRGCARSRLPSLPALPARDGARSRRLARHLQHRVARAGAHRGRQHSTRHRSMPSPNDSASASVIYGGCSSSISAPRPSPSRKPAACCWRSSSSMKPSCRWRRSPSPPASAASAGSTRHSKRCSAARRANCVVCVPKTCRQDRAARSRCCCAITRLTIGRPCWTSYAGARSRGSRS